MKNCGKSIILIALMLFSYNSSSHEKSIRCFPRIFFELPHGPFRLNGQCEYRRIPYYDSRYWNNPYFIPRYYDNFKWDKHHHHNKHDKYHKRDKHHRHDKYHQINKHYR